MIGRVIGRVMRPVRLARLGASLAIAGALVASGCSDRIGHGWEWERMRAQPRYESYGPSAFFSDGSAMHAAPAGTIAREATSLTALTTPPWGADGPSAAIVQRGASRYHIFCAVCHGERGDGESLVAANMDPPRPPSLLVPPASTLAPSALVRLIGIGTGRMPSYAAELSPADRWAVAAYVATFPRPVAGASSAGGRLGRTQP